MSPPDAAPKGARGRARDKAVGTATAAREAPPEDGSAPAAGGLSLAEVQLALGQMALDRGEAEAARDWFRIAARAGDARGYNMLGRCHDRGWGVAADPAAAARYYRKAADLGDVWALFNLADLYCRGRGVPQDDRAAYALYDAAAAHGHAKALNMLGLFHEGGRVVAADPARAAAFFHAAAQGGDCWGAFNHARMLIGRGEEAQALLWLERAMATGFPDFHAAMAAALEGLDDPRFRALARRAAQMAGPAAATAGERP